MTGNAYFARTVDLVRAARGGDELATGEIFERYLPRITEMVALRLGHRLANLVDAEDLVQESMLRALRAIDDFEELTEGTFRAYVSRIVSNCLADAARYFDAQKRSAGRLRRFGDATSTDLPPEDLAAHEDTPSLVLRRKELSDRIEQAVLQLPPRYREVIGLRHVLGLSFAEVAAAMDVAVEATARSLDLRARHELRRILGEDPFPD